VSIEQSIDVISKLLTRGGRKLTAIETNLLQKSTSQHSNDQANHPQKFAADHAIYNSLDEAATMGFYKVAASGELLTANADAFRQFLGRSIEENYPEAGSAFLKFANTYWSLSFITKGNSFDPRRSLAENLLMQLEFGIASVFFPTPGAAFIDPKLREAEQRRLLTNTGAPINIDSFLQQNPILIRDKNRTKSGCATLLLFALGGIAIAGYTLSN